MRDAVLRPAEDDEPLPEGASWSETIRHSMLWKDTRATGLRFIYSMALLFPAVLIGLHMGLFPYFGAFLLRFVLFFDKIIALSLLPILFIAFGIDELSKIMLIVIGRDAHHYARHLQSDARRAGGAGGEGVHAGR